MSNAAVLDRPTAAIPLPPVVTATAPAATRAAVQPAVAGVALYADLPAGAHGISFLAWVALLGAYWLAFAAHAEAALMLGIATFFFVMFVGTPLVLLALAPEEPQLRPGLGAFLGGAIDTHTGPMPGAAALLQVVVVPLSLAGGAIAMGTIFSLAG